MRWRDPLGIGELRQGLEASRAQLLSTQAELEQERQRARRSRDQGRRQQAFRSTRNFAAGQADRLNADWGTHPYSIDEVLQNQLRTLRARSRGECRRNPYGRKFKRSVGANIVGRPGIRLQVRSLDPNGQPDKLANSAIEESWTLWGQSKWCDYERRLTYIQMQRLAVQTVCQDGETFLRRIHEPVDENPWGISYQFMDAELLDIDFRRDLADGGYIRMGVEFDRHRRRRGYWFTDQQRPLSDPSIGYYSTKRVFIPVEEITHLFLAEDPGQTRGVPWLATALYRLRMHGAYEEAALIASRIGAVRGGFFESEFGDEDNDADETDDQGIPTEELSPDEPFRKLPSGTKFTPFTPEYPRGEFVGFSKAMLRGISAGFGLTYHGLANDLEAVNYSTARFGRQDECDVWMELQDWTADDFCDLHHRDWLRMQLLLGTLQVGGGSLRPDREQKYLRHRWQPRTWPSPDPEKDASAAEKEVANGFRSAASVIRERGEDPEEVEAEIADERKRRAAAGIPVVAAAGGAAAPAKPPMASPNENQGEPADSAAAQEDQ
jgi:lambda family phage portal protein